MITDTSSIGASLPPKAREGYLGNTISASSKKSKSPMRVRSVDRSLLKNCTTNSNDIKSKITARQNGTVTSTSIIIDETSNKKSSPKSKSPVRERGPINSESRAITNNVKPDGKIASPETQKKYERQNRRSFQGLSVIGGRSQSVAQKNAIIEKGEDTQRRITERRRCSMERMKKSAQSSQIREILENTTMDDSISHFAVEGTPEERLQAVMTKAKARGMSTENIFAFFNGGNPNTTRITKKTFLEALEKLGDTFLVVTDEELTDLVCRFDKNCDGQISIAEFKNYCYNEIQTVPWKAERHRLEKSGELKKLKAQISRRFLLCDDDDDGDSNSCGDEVHVTSKFFWRTGTNLEIRLFYSLSLDVITMQMFNQTTSQELPSIYVCKNKIEYQISNLAEEINKMVQMSDTRSKDDENSVRTKSTWEFISKYLVARLKLNECNGEIVEDFPSLECSHMPKEASCIPFLCKLSGDTFDTLMIQKPLNLDCPPPITSASSVDDFEKTTASFKRVSRVARTSRQSAQEMTNLVASALSEVLKVDEQSIK